MRVKKHKNGNYYMVTKSGIWIRDFTGVGIPFDINTLYNTEDYKIIVENEIKNSALRISELDSNTVKHSKAIIVSNGHDFDRKQHLLANLPKDVIVLATNRSLVKWKVNQKIDYFVINNPYSDCMHFFPNHRYFPKCIASSRTYNQFLETYDKRGGVIYKYTPCPEKQFASTQKTICLIDDYRNPICASIVLAYRFGIEKLLLFCCDDAFTGERPGADKLSNGLFIYPQHLYAHEIIEANLLWYLKQSVRKVKLANHSSGPDYDQIPYISEESILEFFYDMEIS